jgi:hypothetical protein
MVLHLKDPPAAEAAADPGARRTFKFRQCFEQSAAVLTEWLDQGLIEQERLESYWAGITKRLDSHTATSNDIHAGKLIAYFRASQGKIV